MKAKLLFLHALSPLHPGTGQGIGIIDQPVAREQATGLPFLPGSSLKGVLRDRYKEKKGQHLTGVFGPETTAAHEQAGAAQFGDLRLLLLPVRSLRGVFAWVTSPYLLQRLLRDARDAGGLEPKSVPRPANGSCLIINGSSRLIYEHGDQREVVLEDLALTVEGRRDKAELVKEWGSALAKAVFPGDTGWQEEFLARFCIVPDDVLFFLQETALEVRARIRLMDEHKTVATGGLWYEEALPTESVLAGLVLAAPVQKTGLTDDEVLKEVKSVTGQTVQFGGNATTGHGLCQVTISEGSDNGTV